MSLILQNNNNQKEVFETKQKEQKARAILGKEKFDSIISTEREERKSQKNTAYEIKREYYRYCNILDTLPEYMEKKLENMDINKGYKFRGVILFGKLPINADSKNEPVTIFERINKDIMHIHIWEKDAIYKYEKKGKNKKIFLEKIIRKKISGRSSSIGDYIKK